MDISNKEIDPEEYEDEEEYYDDEEDKEGVDVDQKSEIFNKVMVIKEGVASGYERTLENPIVK